VNDTELNSILEQLGQQIGQLTIALAAANAHSKTLESEIENLKKNGDE
jgi:hypothetical protein